MHSLSYLLFISNLSIFTRILPPPAKCVPFRFFDPQKLKNIPKHINIFTRLFAFANLFIPFIRSIKNSAFLKQTALGKNLNQLKGGRT